MVTWIYGNMTETYNMIPKSTIPVPYSIQRRIFYDKLFALNILHKPIYSVFNSYVE